MTKVLFFGVFTENSTNISQANAFEKNGCQVTRHDFRANPTIPEDDGYDFIFYSKCNELTVSAVKMYAGIKCLWYMDPLNANYSPTLMVKMPYMDFIVFALPEPYHFTIRRLNFSTQCYLIEEGFDPDVDSIQIQITYKYDVSFIGNLRNEERKQFSEKVDFEVIKCSRIEHPAYVSASKINLNLTSGGTSDRAYKVMASGGFLLSQPWPNCPFQNGKEICLFNDTEDCKRKIDYYLKNENKRRAIAINGHTAVQKFSRTIWAERILKIYKSCKS